MRKAAQGAPPLARGKTLPLRTCSTSTTSVQQRRLIVARPGARLAYARASAVTPATAVHKRIRTDRPSPLSTPSSNAATPSDLKSHGLSHVMRGMSSSVPRPVHLPATPDAPQPVINPPLPLQPPHGPPLTSETACPHQQPVPVIPSGSGAPSSPNTTKMETSLTRPSSPTRTPPKQQHQPQFLCVLPPETSPLAHSIRVQAKCLQRRLRQSIGRKRCALTAETVCYGGGCNSCCPDSGLNADLHTRKPTAMAF